MYGVTVSPGRAFADFNMVGSDGTVPVALDEYVGLLPASEGVLVRLEDEDGNSVEAVVTGVGSELLRARPLWESWRDGEVALPLLSAFGGDLVEVPAQRATEALVGTAR